MYSKAIMWRNAIAGFMQSVFGFCNQCLEFFKWCFGLSPGPTNGFFGKLFLSNTGIYGPVANFVQSLCTNLFGVLFVILMTRIVMTLVNFINPNT